MKMAAPYKPSAPTGVGTDDYRCFLLDPHLKEDKFLTGTSVQPGNPDVVHHVILFRVPPDQVANAEQHDASTQGDGWTCFGNSGLGGAAELDNAPWLGAWAPGGHETVFRKGLGVPLDKGSRIVMQVHYNLLIADTPDVSATQLRLAPTSADLTAVETMLLPAAVELPCRAGHTDSPLCDRAAAVADVKNRFGDGPGSTADLLHLLCGEAASKPGEVQSCTRTISKPTTVIGVAGHMHLLGRSIQIEVNPGTPNARTILDIPVWDFDNQGATPIKPLKLDAFDTGEGDLPPRPVAARQAAGLRGATRSVRRLGRGQHRRDVPRHPAGHPSLNSTGGSTSLAYHGRGTDPDRKDAHRGIHDRHAGQSRHPPHGGRARKHQHGQPSGSR